MTVSPSTWGLLFFLFFQVSGLSTSFNISNDQFIKDGKPFQIFAGCFHYSRVPAAYWGDRLARLRSMGFNAIQTYVPWNFHEENEGEFNFDGDHNLSKFIEEAQKADLLVLLRAGPYMCGEWEFGGFPAWLLGKDPPITIRTYEPGYISLVDKYWGQLLPRIKPLMYENGGPVVMMQIENEFGSYGNVANNTKDKQYMEYLVSLARSHLGSGIILYTTDGGNIGHMTRGSLKGSAVYSVGDFGPGSNPQNSFDAQKEFNSAGMSPPMCSEFYSGWLTHWGQKMANTSSSGLASGLDNLVGKYKASFSMYMAYGGTNFGYWSGANGGGNNYQPHITSYDYDSPLSEGGDHGFGSDRKDKFKAVRDVLVKYNPSPPEPAPIPKKSYGNCSLELSAILFSNLETLSPGNLTHRGLSDVASMESFGQNYGFILYSAQIPSSSDHATSGKLEVTEVRDRVQVFVDGKSAGIIYRTSPNAITVPTGKKLDLLVENMGRLNFGRGMTDSKGITHQVTWNGKKISGDSVWTVRSLPLIFDQHIAHLPFVESAPPKDVGPIFYRGKFSISDSPTDTYFSSAGLDKGHMWINGVHLGRYWESKGPQHTLYVPASFLKQGTNDLVILEQEKQLVYPRVRTVDTPVFSINPPNCDPAKVPQMDDPVVMYSCKNMYVNNQNWIFHANGTILLASNSQLCLTIGPNTDPSSGNLAIDLRQCGVDVKSQKFTHKTDKTIINAKNNLCLDITSHLTTDGASVEVYACNGGTNQQWNVPSGSGQITSLQDSHCLTVCPKISHKTSPAERYR